MALSSQPFNLTLEDHAPQDAVKKTTHMPGVQQISFVQHVWNVDTSHKQQGLLSSSTALLSADMTMSTIEVAARELIELTAGTAEV